MKDSSNLIGSSNDETDFPHKLLLTNRVEHIQKELKNSLGIKILQQRLMEYKHMIQQCVDTFVLALLISYYKVKVY